MNVFSQLYVMNQFVSLLKFNIQENKILRKMEFLGLVAQIVQISISICTNIKVVKTQNLCSIHFFVTLPFAAPSCLILSCWVSLLGPFRTLCN